MGQNKAVAAANPGMPIFGEAKMEWSVDEQNSIAADAYAIFGQDPTKGRMFAIRQAVRNLPRKRQMYVTKWYHVRNFIVKSWKVLDEQTGHNYAQADVVHVPMSQPDAPQQLELKETPAAPVAPPPAEVPPAVEAAPAPADDNPTKARKAKVYWKPEDIEKVALAAAELLIENPQLKPVPLTNAAQKIALPEDKHRVMVAIDQCKGVPERAAELKPIIERRNAKRAQEEQEARESAERLERERIEREERERLETEQRIRAEAEADALRLLAEQEEARRRIHAEAFNSAVNQEVQKRLDAAPYTAILGALAKKVMGDFMGELVKEMRGTMEAQMIGLMDELTKPAAPPEPEAQKPRHLSLVVVGLGNQEYDQLRKDFFGDVTFKQVKVLADSRSGQTAQAMLEAARGTDAVLAMHHAVGADVKMAATRLKEMKVPYVAVTGNMRDLKSRIKSALTGELPFEFAA
jgi:hypothetical protein